MKDLREKAATGPDATRMENAAGESFVVVNPALYAPEEVSPEGDYPELGDWLETRDGFLECPGALARELLAVVDNQDFAFPLRVHVLSAEVVDREWSIETEIQEVEE